jgi:hypothetical protein
MFRIAVPLLAPIEPVIVTLDGMAAYANPVESMVATEGLDDDQLVIFALLPSAYLTLPVKRTKDPCVTVAVLGVMVNETMAGPAPAEKLSQIMSLAEG